jgi:hypothetical protein
MKLFELGNNVRANTELHHDARPFVDALTAARRATKCLTFELSMSGRSLLSQIAQLNDGTRWPPHHGCTPDHGGRMTSTASEPPSTAMSRAGTLYDRLPTFGRKTLPESGLSDDYTKIEPELAESFTLLPDGMDGAPVTAETSNGRSTGRSPSAASRHFRWPTAA